MAWGLTRPSWPAAQGTMVRCGSGRGASAQLRARWPRVAVGTVASCNEDGLMIQGRQAGACGYLLKDCTLDTLLNAVRAAAGGERLVQPDVMARILTRAARAVAPA